MSAGPYQTTVSTGTDPRTGQVVVRVQHVVGREFESISEFMLTKSEALKVAAALKREADKP